MQNEPLVPEVMKLKVGKRRPLSKWRGPFGPPFHVLLKDWLEDGLTLDSF